MHRQDGRASFGSVPAAGPIAFAPRYVRNHSLTTSRDYLEVEVEWQAAGPFTMLAAGFGVHTVKASGDLYLAAHLGRPRRAGLSAALRLALLDAFTNPVFALAARDPAQADTHFYYRAQPVAARLDLAWENRTFRVEAVGGVSSRSQVEVTFPNTSEAAFTQSEDYRFAAALLEVRALRDVALAFYGTTSRATTERHPSEPGAGAFDLLEETSAAGGRAQVRVSRSATVELDSRVVWRPERRGLADSVIRHEDREVLSQVMLVRRPPEDGYLARVGIASMSRQAGTLAPQLHDTDSRFLTEFGWLFRSGFELSFGVRWDLDASGTFDGGHLRVAATW